MKDNTSRLESHFLILKLSELTRAHALHAEAIGVSFGPEGIPIHGILIHCSDLNQFTYTKNQFRSISEEL
jgi:hypothetical protein